MSTHKHINLICVAVLVCTLLITVLFMNGARLGIRSVTDGDSSESSGLFTANDLNGNWDTDSATVIDLDTSHITGGGAYFYDGDLIISGGGYFVISGTMADGRILVDSDKSSKIWIQLNQASVHCSDDACFQILQARKVFLSLAEGTENSLSSGAVFSQEAEKAGRHATLFSSDNLTINGTGSLTVTGQYRHGIEANDNLVITGGCITVTAPADGISVNDSLCICNADVVIRSEDDGITVKTYETGSFYLASGTLDISCPDDGIRAAGPVSLAGGSCTIVCGSKGILSEASITVTDCTLHIDDCSVGLTAPEIDAGDNVAIQAKGEDIKVTARDDGAAMTLEEYNQLFGPEPEPEPEPVEYTADTFVLLGISALILLAGLCAAFLYKKRFVR